MTNHATTLRTGGFSIAAHAVVVGAYPTAPAGQRFHA